MITKRVFVVAVGYLYSLMAVVSPEARAITWNKFECQAVPSTGARTYNTNIQCVIEVTRTGASKWHNAHGQDCSTFCRGLGGVNVNSPDGFACTSGEVRPLSAIQAGVDYSPTGCWRDCRSPMGGAGAASVGGRCYSPGQKRDNDGTDVTVGCFCDTGEVGVTSVDLGITNQGVARASGVVAYPSGWSRVDKNVVNDSANRIVNVVGAIPLGGTGKVSMSVNVQGACGTSAVLGGSVYGGDSSLRNVTVPLPACGGQCSDGVDNDNDGAADLADFSCQNDSSRDDEANPKSQCQNGSDDDNDGLTDLNDFGCSTAQDNNESDGTSQCQDMRDNDSDGLIDLKDPGCSNSQDNDEFDTGSIITLGVECVTANTDGSKTAYFSYNNTSGGETAVVTNTTLGTVNDFMVSGGVASIPPALFKRGIAKGAVAVRFFGDSISWVVQTARSAASRATVSAATPACAPVVPLAECRTFLGGTLTVQVGYSNGNQFEQEIAVGAANQFTPGAADRGQPTRFFAGLNKGVFKVPLGNNTESFTWFLNGKSVKVDSSLPTCADGCIDAPTGTITSELDAVAQELSNLMTRAANVLASSKVAAGETAEAQRERNRVDAERAMKKALSYAKEAKEITIQFPKVIKTCAEAPQYCETVDRQGAIESLKVLYRNQVNSIRRTIARAYFRNSGKTSRTDANVAKAKEFQKQGLASLQKLPRFDTQCK